MSASVGDRVRVLSKTANDGLIAYAAAAGLRLAEAGEEGTVVAIYDGQYGAPDGAVYVEFDEGFEHGVSPEQFEVVTP